MTTQEACVKAVKNIALEGSSVAGTNKSTPGFVRKLPEEIRTTEALFNADLEKILDGKMLLCR